MAKNEEKQPKSTNGKVQKAKSKKKESAKNKTKELDDCKKECSTCKCNKQKKDWNDEINPEALYKDEITGGTFIPLEELQRIADLRGIKGVDTKVWNIDFSSACVTVKITWEDGTWSSGSADAGPHNIPDTKFAIFPTAIAESRALARALRFGLGIKICSKEEIATFSGVDFNPSAPISAHQKICIQNVLKRKNLEEGKVLSLGKRKVNSLDELTVSEATALIKALSSGKIEEVLKKKEK